MENVIKKIKTTFSNFKKPDRIAISGDQNDQELQQVQRQFENIELDTMSYEDSSMMIIDGPLISPSAFWYFLPKIIEYVLKQDGDVFMLMQRLTNIDKGQLSDEQKTCVNELIDVLDKLEEENI